MLDGLLQHGDLLWLLDRADLVEQVRRRHQFRGRLQRLQALRHALVHEIADVRSLEADPPRTGGGHHLFQPTPGSGDTHDLVGGRLEARLLRVPEVCGKQRLVLRHQEIAR